MKIFVITICILFLVESILKLQCVMGEHPRKIKSRTFINDLTQFVILAGFAAWAGYLLFK